MCDGLDNNCDGIIPSDELDADADGFAACEGDCDDGNALVFPNAAELCDGLDNDCNNQLPALEQDIDGVFFTGSYETGGAIAAKVAPRMLKMGLALGGKDPAYVRADANLDHAVENLVDGAMFNSGSRWRRGPNP